MEKEEKESGPAATHVAKQHKMAGSSSSTPKAPAVKSSTLALGPQEDPESKNEPDGHKEEDPNSKVEREEKQREGCKEDPKPSQPEGQPKKKRSNKTK